MTEKEWPVEKFNLTYTSLAMSAFLYVAIKLCRKKLVLKIITG